MDYQPVKQGSFFKRKSRTEKLLCTFLILVLIIAIILAVCLILLLHKVNNANETRNLCQTPDCVSASVQILRNMDQDVDPCDDFYEFACGKFLKTTVIPPSSTVEDSFRSLGKIIDQQVQTVLEGKPKPGDTRTLGLVKKVYESCMNETDIELNSIATVKSLIKQLGGWPVLEGTRWRESNFDWITTLLNLRDTGLIYTMLLDFSVDVDNKNSSKRVLIVDQPFMSLESTKRGPRENPVLNANKKFMVDVAVVYGADKNLAEAEMEHVLLFDMELSKIMVPPEDRRDLEQEYNPIKIRELERNYPLLPWHYFINRIIAPSKLTHEDVVIVYLPQYLRNLQQLIARTPKRVLANYILYKTIGSMISYSNKALRDIQLEFTKATVNVATSLPRSEVCTSVASRLEIAAGALYVSRYFDEQAKYKTVDMVHNIEEQFVKTLNKVDWMDQDTKTAALEKLRAMEKYIGYPEELIDEKKLEQYYEDLQLNSDNYMEVILNVSKFQTEKDMKKLSEPVIKSDWRTRSSVAVVNAYYDLNANAIQVPAGILQGVFFNAKRPEYLNYGGIGFIIGHEFTHGFDDEGSQMDKNGNLMEWWKKSTKEAYDKKAECIVRQYTDILIPEINMTINGKNTQGENIADNGGIKLAYLAYKEWATKNPVEPTLPGLNFTPDQMFWISAANAWCSKMKPQAMKQEVMNEVHPPDKYRINVPFANSGFFAKDFYCPIGSKMNPVHTCSVW